MYGVDVVFRPYLARGFSYYNGTVFEVASDKLNVSIMGGGSYLINGVQSTGISFGIEPIMLLTDISGDSIEYLIISLGQDKEAINIADKLRNKGNKTQLMVDKTLNKALEYANAKNIQNVVVIGDEEVGSKKYQVKNMQTGKTSTLKV